MITNAQSQHWEISITWICACVHVAHMAHVCTWHSPVRDMCCAHARRMWAHASESPPPPSLLSLFCPHCRCLRRCHCAGLLPSSDLLPAALRIHSCSGCFHDRLIFQRKAYRISLVLSLPGFSVAPPTWDCRPNPQIRRFAVALCCDALLSQDFDLLNWTLCSLNDCSERLFVVTKKKVDGSFLCLALSITATPSAVGRWQQKRAQVGSGCVSVEALQQDRRSGCWHWRLYCHRSR